MAARPVSPGVPRSYSLDTTSWEEKHLTQPKVRHRRSLGRVLDDKFSSRLASFAQFASRTITKESDPNMKEKIIDSDYNQSELRAEPSQRVNRGFEQPNIVPDLEINRSQAESFRKEKRGKGRRHTALSESEFWAAWQKLSMVSEHVEDGIDSNNLMQTDTFDDTVWSSHHISSRRGTYPLQQVTAPTSCNIRSRRASQSQQCVVYE